MLHFTGGEKKICSSIKIFQNIMNRVVAKTFKATDEEWLVKFIQNQQWRHQTDIRYNSGIFLDNVDGIPHIGYWGECTDQ